MYKIKLKAVRWFRSFTAPATGESGRIRIRVVCWMAFIALAIYGAILVVPPYLSYKMLQYEVAGEAEVAHMYTDAQIESRILSKAASWSIDIDQYDIDVSRDYEEIDISISYGVSVVFFGRYEKIFYYDIYLNKLLKQT